MGNNITTFITNNLVFILAIASALITFLIFLVEKLVKKQKLKLLLIFAALGLLAFVGKEIIALQESKSKALLEQKKGEIVQEILDNTRVTLSLVETLSEELTGENPGKIGVELVQSETKRELDQFFKGSPELWRRYAQWLETFENRQDKAPCLSFKLNAGKFYNANLILAYLFTNKNTRNKIGEVIMDWRGFPDDQFINEFGPPRIDVKYVLFYDGESEKPVGYADANHFAYELWRYLAKGKRREVEDILNKPYSGYMADMKRYFESFRDHVAETKDALTAAEKMLAEELDELAVVHKDKVYLVRLSKIVKLVS